MDINSDGVLVRIYGIARTIVDCFKYRNKLGLDVAVEALRFARARKRISSRQAEGPVAAGGKVLEMTTSNRIPALTPRGHLVLAPTDEARTLAANLQERLEAAFERGAGHGLLELGICEVGTALPAEFAYWRDLAGRYVTTLCTSARSASRIRSIS